MKRTKLNTISKSVVAAGYIAWIQKMASEAQSELSKSDSSFIFNSANSLEAKTIKAKIGTRGKYIYLPNQLSAEVLQHARERYDYIVIDGPIKDTKFTNHLRIVYSDFYEYILAKDSRELLESLKVVYGADYEENSKEMFA